MSSYAIQLKQYQSKQETPRRELPSIHHMKSNAQSQGQGQVSIGSRVGTYQQQLQQGWNYILQYIFSMAEEQVISQLSMATTQNATSQRLVPQPQLRLYSISILLVLAGFYFLVFAIIELVTNYSEHVYESSFNCSGLQCVAQVDSISFPGQQNIYLYLENPQITQTVLEGFVINYEQIITGCSTYSTNQQADKNVSLTGSALAPASTAYPCGQIAMLYPQAAFTVRNLETNSYLNVIAEDLSISKYGFQNQNLSTQWADVESSRYSVWSEANIGLGLKKYWGYISVRVPESIEIVLTSTNELQVETTKGLKVQLTDGLALSGYNIPLCVFNFLWAVAAFTISCLSFWMVGKQKSSGWHSTDQLSKESMPEYSYPVQP